MVNTEVAGVFVTEQLAARKPRQPDYLREKEAILRLAASMADRPQEVLPDLVDLGMEIAGGVSAGISLYEPEPAPGVFRWRYLRGLLSRFENATTPRHHSPCGVTLDKRGPVLCQHPERVYSWISEANIVVPEVLLVPLYIGSDDPLGTLWIVADEVGQFDKIHARAVTELAKFVGIALRMVNSERQLRAAVEGHDLLMREMGHRVKNLFAMTTGLIRLSARECDTAQDLASVLSGRVQALASAHALVHPSFTDHAGIPDTPDLAALVRAILRPHGDERAVVNGPVVRCTSQATTAMALVLHELATNAAKYGSLSVPGGTVLVSWSTDPDSLILNLVEEGGPAVRPPRADGFGAHLMQTTVVRQFGGDLNYGWLAEGLAVTMRLPIAPGDLLSLSGARPGTT